MAERKVGNGVWVDYNPSPRAVQPGSQQTFDSIVKDLQEAKIWLSSSGLSTANTRLDKYLCDIQMIEPDLKQDYAAKPRLKSSLINSLFEGAEIGRVFRAFRVRRQQALIVKLLSAIEGPIFPEDENEQSAGNRARNILFELSVAAQFARARLKVVLGETPDVRVIGLGIPLLLQCKRLMSGRALTKALTRARRQLKRDLEAYPTAAGVTAIDVSKVANKGNRILVANDKSEGLQKLGQLVEKISETHE